MEKDLVKLALEYHANGFSCSESIVKAAADCSMCDENLVDVATPFSGGMSSGCLCGAISGAQIVIGFKHGRTKTALAREKAAQFVSEFKKQNGATCCRVLTKDYEFGSLERRANCHKLVECAAKILKELI